MGVQKQSIHGQSMKDGEDNDNEHNTAHEKMKDGENINLEKWVCMVNQ